MSYFLWAMPVCIVIAALVSRRCSALAAGLIGAALALAVATTVAPVRLGLDATLAKGLWLSWLVGAVILGGLFFRIAVSPTPAPSAAATSGTSPAHAGAGPTPTLRRRRAFAACLLIGPFSEAATGFGVGQVTTIAILLTLGLKPLQAAVLGLFSQILVPWGAMANGTTVGAAFSGLSPHDLGVYSAIVNMPLVLAWLVLFWRTARWAGLSEAGGQRLIEFGWMAAMAGGLLLANGQLGPEVAALATLGPLIALQFLWDERPDRARLRSLLPIVLPYALLILVLGATRAIPALHARLRDMIALQPFADGIG